MERYFQAEKKDDTVRTSGVPVASYGWRPTESFAEWEWDGKTLTVRNDRYGIYPIFYHHVQGRITVSASVSALLDRTGDTELEDEALALFLRLGWLIGEDTLFKNIRALPPGCKLTWHDGELTIDSKGIFYLPPLDIDRDEAISEYARLFAQAIKRTLPEGGRTAVPLSGGRDSRHILFELCRQGHVPDACVTISHQPPRPDEDTRVAAMVCEELGVTHHLVGQPSSRFKAECQKNRFTGFSAYEHGWFFALSPFISGRWTNIYDGLAGDVLSAGLFLDETRLRLFRECRLDALVEKILDPEGYLNVLLPRDLHSRFSREVASKALRRELQRHAQAPNPIGSFYFWNRTRRCIALSPFRLIRDSEHVVAPYLEPELYDFLASLPAEMLVDHAFHTDTISRTYPEYAHIPYERKRIGPKHDDENYRSLLSEILRYSLSPRKRKLVNRVFLIKRALLSHFVTKANHSVADFGEMATHLLQLERL